MSYFNNELLDTIENAMIREQKRTVEVKKCNSRHEN